ncbi:MAG: TadE/TadG family type IV pilus assembly protein [Acidimicrobiales bacterium]
MRRRGPGPEGVERADRGQTTVELALALPLVLVLVLLIVQVGCTVHDQVVVTHAAREAARASAVDADPGVVRRAAEAGGGLDPDLLDVSVLGRDGPGGAVTVEVRYRSPVRVPLLRVALPQVGLSARTTMRVER